MVCVLVRGSAWIDGSLTTHIITCHLNLEQCPIRTHTELEAQPVAVIELLPIRRTWQSRWADHHSSIQDNAVFLLRGRKKSTTSDLNKAGCFCKGQAGLTNK